MVVPSLVYTVWRKLVPYRNMLYLLSLGGLLVVLILFELAFSVILGLFKLLYEGGLLANGAYLRLGVVVAVLVIGLEFLLMMPPT